MSTIDKPTLAKLESAGMLVPSPMPVREDTAESAGNTTKAEVTYAKGKPTRYLPGVSLIGEAQINIVRVVPKQTHKGNKSADAKSEIQQQQDSRAPGNALGAHTSPANAPLSRQENLVSACPAVPTLYRGSGANFTNKSGLQVQTILGDIADRIYQHAQES
jgi:hypothetical protein